MEKVARANIKALAASIAPKRTKMYGSNIDSRWGQWQSQHL